MALPSNSIVWPKTNGVSACDEVDGEYRTVFGMATIADDDLVEFVAVLDCDIAARGFAQETRRVWCNETKGWRDVVVSFGTADSANADTASKPG